MQDFVPLGTGNSRSLKSSISAETTWEQALEMLRNGTFPIDIGAVNDAGVSQKGTPLNMASLLALSVATKYGKGAEAVPSEIFDILSKAALVGEDGKLVTPAGSSVAQVNMESWTYIGTGKYGSSGKSSISYTKKPDLILVSGRGDGEFGNYSSMALLNGVPEYINSNYGQGIIFLIDKIEWGDKSVFWYSTMSAGAQANLSSQTYQYTLFFRG